MEIYRLLYPTDGSATLDKGTFTRWADGQITTTQCINEFRFNNKLDKDIYISEFEFVRWLESLGYWR